MNDQPKNFTSYKNLTICGNTLTNVKHIFTIGDIIPLRIGSGDTPKVWISAFVGPDKNDYLPLVEESLSKLPTINIYEEDSTLYINIQEKLILSVTQVDKDTAIVEHLDLRPIGIDVHGDKSVLFIGIHNFRNCKIINTPTFAKII